MLNLLKKSTPWMVASLFVATSVFGQQSTNAAQNSCAPKCAPKCEPKCEPKCPPKPCPKPCPQPTPPTQVCPADPCCPPWSTPVLNAAYNYPARVQTRCPWDLNFDLSFIYWQPVQENMELGMIDNGGNTGWHEKLINQDFDFKPGFKIGMGGNYDHDGWDSRFQYTWFHNTQSNSESVSSTASPAEFIYALRGPQSSGSFTSVSQNWKLNMDIAEFDLGRSYYVGTKLTFRPNFGVRAAWIGQKLNTKYTSTVANALDVYTISGKSSSWGVGAKAGLNTNWMICSDFRLFGNAEADLLFTKYTSLSMNSAHTAVGLLPASIKQSKVYAVKPHIDLELGLGWGTYLDCNNYYWDFALSYEFQVFFDQNMFRNFTSSSPTYSNMPNGNLYLNGLTFTTKLDF